MTELVISGLAVVGLAAVLSWEARRRDRARTSAGHVAGTRPHPRADPGRGEDRADPGRP